MTRATRPRGRRAAAADRRPCRSGPPRRPADKPPTGPGRAAAAAAGAPRTTPRSPPPRAGRRAEADGRGRAGSGRPPARLRGPARGGRPVLKGSGKGWRRTFRLTARPTKGARIALSKPRTGSGRHGRGIRIPAAGLAALDLAGAGVRSAWPARRRLALRGRGFQAAAAAVEDPTGAAGMPLRARFRPPALPARTRREVAAR